MKNISIIIVIDPADDIRPVTSALEKGGFRVKLEVLSDRKALCSALAKRPWDAVIVTAHSSLEMLKVCKECDPDIPFIIVSDETDEAAVAHIASAIRAGASEYVTLKYIDNLLPILERELKYAQANREKSHADETVAHYKLLFDNISDLVYICDDKGDILYLNSAFDRLSGCKRDDYINKPFAPLFDEENLKVATKFYKKTLGGESPTFELSFKESGILCEYKALPLRDGDGRITGVLGSARDVTGRRLAEKALSEANKEFHAKLTESELAQRLFKKVQTFDLTDLETFPEIVYLQARDHTIPFANRRFREEYGEPGARPCYEVMWNRNEPCDECRTFEVFDTREPMEWISNHLSSGKFYHVYDYPFEDTDGTFLVLEISIDITEQRRAEEEIRLLAEMTANITEGASLVRVSDGTIVYANERYEEIFGYGPGELISKHISEINAPSEDGEDAKDDKEVFTEVSAALKRDGIWTGEVRNLKKDGTIITTYAKVSAFESTKYGAVWLGMLEDITEKKRAEKALVDSEARFRRLVETTPHGIQENDLNGTITFSNLAHAKMLGYEEGELVGRAIWDFYEDDDERQAITKYLQYLIVEEPVPSSYVGKNITKDGRSIYLQIDWNYMRDDKGVLIGFVSIITDITEQREAREELEESRELLESVIDNSTAVIYIKDPEGRYIHANRCFNRLFNLTKDEISGKTDHELFPLEAADAFRKNDLEVIKAGAPLEFEEIAYSVDGPHTYISKKFPLYDSSQTLYAVCGISSDITERKRAEEALKESEQRFRAVFENAIDGIAIADISDRSIYTCNETFAKMLGYTIEEVTGLKVEDLHPKESSALEEFELVLKKEKKFVGDFPVLRKDGTIFHADISPSVMNIQGKELVMGIFRDITERLESYEEKERLQEQLMQSQKMEAIGRLTGAISHDFNNMMMCITTLCRLGIMDSDENGPVRGYFGEIDNASKRARNLTSLIANYGLKGLLQSTRVDINEVIESELMDLLSRLIGVNYEIKYDLAESLWSVYVDKAHIEQVLTNIILNARDSMEGGGVITVVTDNVEISGKESVQYRGGPGRYVRLSVGDRGTGMDKETAQKIYEPYFTTKGPGDGTGLGLSIVYDIIKDFKGWIDIDTEEGKGTTFNIYMPAGDKLPGLKNETAAKMHAARIAGRGELILVVEDDEFLCSATSQLLIRNGYRVEAASGADEARRIFNKEGGSVSLLLCDLALPGNGGVDIALVIELSKIEPDIKVMLLGEQENNVTQSSEAEKRGYLYLEKPVDSTELLVAIKKLLDSSKV